MEDKTKDEGTIDEVDIHKVEIECGCCQGGSCGWNPTARPQEEEKGQVKTPPQGHARGPPCQFEATFNRLMLTQTNRRILE